MLVEVLDMQLLSDNESDDRGATVRLAHVQDAHIDPAIKLKALRLGSVCF